MVNDTVIMALLDKLIPSTCMVIDCLELLEGRKAQPSKKRREAAHKADRIVMPYHRSQHRLFFVYSLPAERLEVLDSLPGRFVEEECPESVRDLLSNLLDYDLDVKLHVRPCPRQAGLLDCGIHVVHYAHRISTDQQIPSDVDAVSFRQVYHAILSSCESFVVRYIPSSPPEALYSTSNTSKEEDHQAGVRSQAEESRRELLRKSDSASRIFRDMEAAGQHCLPHLENQMSNMASDTAAANSLLDAVLSTAKNIRDQTERENLKTWIPPMVDQFPKRCRKKCEGCTNFRPQHSVCLVFPCAPSYIDMIWIRSLLNFRFTYQHRYTLSNTSDSQANRGWIEHQPCQVGDC